MLFHLKCLHACWKVALVMALSALAKNPLFEMDKVAMLAEKAAAQAYNEVLRRAQLDMKMTDREKQSAPQSKIGFLLKHNKYINKYCSDNRG